MSPTSLRKAKTGVITHFSRAFFVSYKEAFLLCTEPDTLVSEAV